MLLPFVSPSRDGKIQTTRLETRTSHRDGPGGLFIGASKHLFALMNPAPAELLHHLIYAALQPHLATPLFCKSPSHVGGDGGADHALKVRCNRCSQKKRRQQSRRRNAVSEKPTGFSK
ncbi:MAG TPA: hypothetical protein VM571_05665 [Noviherbaspirillum sp.]|nr:hypothetical protein [Noviherbaspirillum sp.]